MVYPFKINNLKAYYVNIYIYFNNYIFLFFNTIKISYILLIYKIHFLMYNINDTYLYYNLNNFIHVDYIKNDCSKLFFLFLLKYFAAKIYFILKLLFK